MKMGIWTVESGFELRISVSRVSAVNRMFVGTKDKMCWQLKFCDRRDFCCEKTITFKLTLFIRAIIA